MRDSVGRPCMAAGRNRAPGWQKTSAGLLPGPPAGPARRAVASDRGLSLPDRGLSLPDLGPVGPDRDLSFPDRSSVRSNRGPNPSDSGAVRSDPTGNEPLFMPGGQPPNPERPQRAAPYEERVTSGLTAYQGRKPAVPNAV